jgi:hypothetical protein
MGVFEKKSKNVDKPNRIGFFGKNEGNNAPQKKGKNMEKTISTQDDFDPFTSPKEVGDLTVKGYAALEDVSRLSPGYTFVVNRYAGRGQPATHVYVYDVNETHVGLVGANAVQFYDNKEETLKAVVRVARRVYHWRTILFPNHE